MELGEDPKKDDDADDRPDELAAQVRYARWLQWGTRVSLAVLIAGFAAYVSGLLRAQVPIEQLPELWGRSASELLAHTGIAPGWAWASLVERGDMLVLAAIALMASCSIPPLAAAIPIFRKRREGIFVLVCALEIVVLVLAASGLFTMH